MWNALAELGFEHGTLLEPGSGMGNFIGLAPEEARMTGVELDHTTAELAGHLYSQATIRAERFGASRFPNNSFILKSLAFVRPGGVAAFVTSAYTMDSQNPAARKEMNQLADFLGAVRLPNNAHQRAAGTECCCSASGMRLTHPGMMTGSAPHSRTFRPCADRPAPAPTRCAPTTTSCTTPSRCSESSSPPRED